MTNTLQTKIHIDSMWGLFIGQFNDNVLHRHYALQISVASRGNFEIIDENDIQKPYSACFINSNVKHQFKSNETTLIILINPISTIGHYLYDKYRNEQIARLNGELNQISDIFISYLRNDFTFTGLAKNISNYFVNFKCECELENHFADDRIYKAIQHLEQNFDRIIL
jgi:hypothetical protein